ncbi:uncharacterized protein LOC116193085 [Punica granatum]|uniref:Water stress and hypersensitive response domain-containing protein n=2 Tax=Punica granatum TaxID=22663 RepID=A0A218WGY3_PUNGR|nr:uncharacterized protein LOC116193085 [Punica granatum]OWM72097.1 hypothetical protein CDL15_Pgr017980 [Punica granatum]PKI56901.1 hypothetical protein CRG98_022730 [Punica granatum]
MAEREQVKPLAPVAGYQIHSDEDEALSTQFSLQQRNYLKCCGCVTAVLLILAVVILILVFTVFQVKDPKIRMNQVTVTRLDFANGTLRQDVNVTLLADVSIKNPNVASFRFSNTTTSIFYEGTLVGEGRTPGGKAPAHRTLRLNMTLDIIPAKLMAIPGLRSDLGSGALTVESSTKVHGRVKIMSMIKKKVVVRLNCTITYNIATTAVQEDCKRHISF